LKGARYGLPTEAQWEYACRAGTTTRFSFRDGDRRLWEYVWFSGNSDSKTHAVGQMRSNAFGLCDMHGNVWEWCWDGYGGKYNVSAPVANRPGPSGASARVAWGGSWGSIPRDCRAASRGSNSPGFRGSYLGFRVARVQSDQ
jgi:formylglycine-generating enzyme required for sulfatase activity